MNMRVLNASIYNRRWILSLVLFFLGGFGLMAQEAASDFAVQVSAIVQDLPPQINLSWPNHPDASSYSIYRKALADTAWKSVITLDGSANSYVDASVSAGVAYEYQLVKKTSQGYQGTGYIYAGVKVPLVENRGRLILVVADTYAAALQAELSRLEQDLTGDGWRVLRHAVSPTDSVASVKALIKADYDADPANTEAVFLFGHIPVPYSGNINPDEHENHKGAWPADAYYGDMTGVWTDSSVNTRSAERPVNWNVPGDGKFDPSTIPGTVRLQMGRVDLSNLTSFENQDPARSELDLLRQYLNKDHKFRHGLLNVNRRGVIMDNFGIDDGVPYASTGWRNFGPLVGANNIDVAQPYHYFDSVTSQSYLWSYACGGGQYTSCEGVGGSDDFAHYDIQAVFTMFFGSYYGDWDNESNFLRSVLGSGQALTASCSGLPQAFYQHMGLGQTVGFGNRLTQNNRTNGLYSPQFDGNRQVHISLMGDPSLRMHVVSPPSNLQVVRGLAGNLLTWSPSADGRVLGYHVYRASLAGGAFTRLTANLLTNLTFTDILANPTNVYMIKAVKLETSPSGSYYNSSQGIFEDSEATIQDPPAGPSDLKLMVISTNSIVVRWNDNATNEDGYLVERSTISGPYVQVAVLGADATQYTDSVLDAGVQYYYRVRCVRGDLYSLYSAESYATTFLTPPVFVEASASAVALDTTTAGTWSGHYGSDGYLVFGSVIQNPGFVAPTSPDAIPYNWQESTVDPRALMTGSNSTDRVAAAWYGDQFQIDLNFTDGKTHRTAFYFLDWDGLGRAEEVSIINGTNEVVMLSESITNFSTGKYWVVDLQGHVILSVRSTQPGANAVLSGIFFTKVDDPIPLVLGNVRFEAGQVTVPVTGDPGTKIVLQSTTDFNLWTSISTNILSATDQMLHAPTSVGSCQFYRCVVVP
ncbi:MAG: hypothetical protein JWM68_4239 [Verrucomicrobiales bacterium]|nr:hypothetical protein [Verrucomicrobiales bacterium]